MRVLVTGGAGFIGNHLVALLVREGIETCVFDSLVSGKRERLPANVDFIQGDIRDREALAGAMRDSTHVVHLAALISVAESMSDPLATHEVNVTGTEHVLDGMRVAGIKRIVYASSAAVYGNEPSLPKSETSPLAPQSPYALSKVLNEAQAGLHERAYGLSPVGLRFFNVYGPGQKGDHPYASVVPRWIEAIRAGRGITLYGDGTQTRDFVHVSDIATAIYAALTVDVTGILNIASGKEVSLNDLLRLLAMHYQGQFAITHEPFRKGDILRSVADISAAHHQLNFTPTTELSDGISELLHL